AFAARDRTSASVVRRTRSRSGQRPRSVLPAGAGAHAGRRRPGAPRQRVMPVLARSASLIVAGAIVLCPWSLSGQSPGVEATAAPAAQTPDPPRQEPIASQALQATQ